MSAFEKNGAAQQRMRHSHRPDLTMGTLPVF
jgi:hypothetical protein